jgi:hypothetical protein
MASIPSPHLRLISLSISPEGAKITCKKCLLQGNIDLARGNVKIRGDGIVDNVREAIDFFTDGTIKMDVDGLSAHIELALQVDATAGAFNYGVPLPRIALSPFQIPGVVAFGVVLRPQILVSVDAGQKIDLSYGFNLTVRSESNCGIHAVY